MQKVKKIYSTYYTKQIRDLSGHRCRNSANCQESRADKTQRVIKVYSPNMKSLNIHTKKRKYKTGNSLTMYLPCNKHRDNS